MEVKYCENCGNAVSFESQFCNKCGYSFANAKVTKAKTNLGIVFGIIGIIVVAILLALILYLNSDSHKSKVAMREAKHYYEAGNYEEAYKKYTTAYKLAKNKSDVESGLVDACKAYAKELYKDDEIKDAIEILEDGYDLTDAKTLERRIEEYKEDEAEAPAAPAAVEEAWDYEEAAPAAEEAWTYE